MLMSFRRLRRGYIDNRMRSKCSRIRIFPGRAEFVVSVPKRVLYQVVESPGREPCPSTGLPACLGAQQQPFLLQVVKIPVEPRDSVRNRNQCGWV